MMGKSFRGHYKELASRQGGQAKPVWYRKRIVSKEKETMTKKKKKGLIIGQNEDIKIMDEGADTRIGEQVLHGATRLKGK